MSNTEIAKTILQQLGGNKFVVMTGAKHLVAGENYLSFRLPGGSFTKGGINAFTITLTAMDDYTLEGVRVRAGKINPVSRREGVYDENLRAVFEDMTGLRTSMGSMGRAA